ncbi:hypothetical protein GCM10020256_46060 [Streptomyces thermocoprophilus]
MWTPVWRTALRAVRAVRVVRAVRPVPPPSPAVPPRPTPTAPPARPAPRTAPAPPRPPGASTPSADTSTGSPEATPDTSGGTGAADGSTATPGATATPETPAQETDSSPTAEPNYDESDNLGQPVGISGLVDTGALGLDGQSGGRHRGPSADEDASGASTAPTGRHAAPAEGAGSGSYTVRVGDSLASIADSLDLDGGWHRLYDDNKDAIGADPSHIVPGQTLRVGG